MHQPHLDANLEGSESGGEETNEQDVQCGVDLGKNDKTKKRFLHFYKYI